MTKLISKRGREKLGANGKIKYTPFEVDEIRFCTRDPMYFISRYIKTQHPVLGATMLPIEKHQVDYINAINNSKNLIAMLPRQTGMTSKTIAFLLWEALFRVNQRIIVQGVNVNTTKYMCDLLGFLVDHLPAFLKCSVTTKRRTTVEFENGSSIVIGVISGNALRGAHYTRLYLDCFALAPDRVQQEVFIAAAPMLAKGRVVMSSTPNGPTNTFAQIWSNASKHLGHFTPFKRTVDDLPHALSWKMARKAQMSERDWQREYMCEFIP